MRLLKTIGFAVLLAATTQCGKPQDEGVAGAPPATSAAAPAAIRAKFSPSPLAMRMPIDGLSTLGSDRALVTIVAFTDYQCPYCARAEQNVTALRGMYGDDVRVVIGQHPLPMHERARPAALAALAAEEQGAFGPMHARLFAHRATLDDAALRQIAEDIGLDVAKFDAARRGPTALAALERAEALGKTAGVTGTPTFFINGRRISGAQPLDMFKTMIDEELVRARALVAGGTAREDVYAEILRTAKPLEPVAAPNPPTDTVMDPVPEALASLLHVENAPVRGADRAPVTVVFFSDFECPYCARAQATLAELEKSFTGKVRIAHKSRPLAMHDHARLAAKAGLAAHAQGKFWEYHDVLFAHRDALDREALEGYARTVGLDVARFNRDIDSAALESRLAADEADATGLGVDGTPTTFVNGRRITGAQPIGTFKAAVEMALAQDR